MGVYDVRLVDKDKRTDAEKSKDNSPDSEIVLGVRATPHDVVQTSHQPVASHRKDDLGKLIWTAADQSDSTSLELFLKECKSRQDTASLMYADTKGRTPLHQAVHNKSIETVQALLEAGAGVMTLDKNGKVRRSFLHQCALFVTFLVRAIVTDTLAPIARSHNTCQCSCFHRRLSTFARACLESRPCSKAPRSGTRPCFTT